MRKPLDLARLRSFLTALGRVGQGAATAYLVGGASAVVEGWRPTTLDLDLRLEPERDDLLRAISHLKEEHQVNVEFASPLDFLPELPGWRDRSPFVNQEGPLTVRQFDFYSQALAKLERGFDQDISDVRAMVERGLITISELERLFEAITGDLYRFPTVDEAALRAALRRLSSGE